MIPDTQPTAILSISSWHWFLVAQPEKLQKVGVGEMLGGAQKECLGSAGEGAKVVPGKGVFGWCLERKWFGQYGQS